MNRKKSSKLTAYNRWGYAFVAPFVIVFLIFSVYPVLRTLYLSFTDLKLMNKEHLIGFANYTRVFKDKFFWRALGNTARIWGVNIVLQLGLAFLLMMVFSDVKYKMKGLGIYRIVYYLPNLMSAAAVAILFKTFLDYKFGTFNWMIRAIYGFFGQKYTFVNWLGSGMSAGYSISVIQSWMWFGNSFIMLMAAVQGISNDYFEAAAIDGAGRWTIFGRITLPLIKPIMMYVAITSLIGGLQMFDIPQLIIGKADTAYDGVETAIMYLYKFAFVPGTTQTAYASAVAYVLFLIILTISVIQIKLFNRKE